MMTSRKPEAASIAKGKAQEKHWYLLYTNPRAEKKVELELRKAGFVTYLPLQKTLKQWSDRKKWVEEPLFKSYMFIETELERNFYQILNTPGVVKFVNFESKPAIVQLREIETIRLILGNFSELEINEAPLEPGEIAEVLSGPLMGQKGRVLEKNGNQWIAVLLESLQQEVVVRLPAGNLRKV